MHVAFFHNSPTTLLRLRGDLIQLTLERGHRVSVFVPSPPLKPSFSPLNRVKYQEIPINRLGINPYQDIQTYIKTVQTLQTSKPDVLFNTTVKPIIYGSLAAQRTSVPTTVSMVTGLGRSFLQTGLRGHLINRIVRLLFRKAFRANQTLFFHNVNDFKLLQQFNLIPKEIPTHVLPGGGVSLSRFPFKPLLPTPITFLFMARLQREKGLFEFLEAAHRVRSQYPQTKYIVCGPLDSNKDESKKRLERAIQQDDVQYLGPTETPWEELEKCHVFVLPSYREGYSRAIQEAMAIGRAIITTNVPGCQDAIDPDKNGVLIEPYQVDPLMKAMVQFIKNPHMAEKMGLRSREIAEERFNEKKINACILDTLKL